MAKIISHRANLNGPNGPYVNTKVGIDQAIKEDFDVEIDLWYFSKEENHKGFWIGHDQAVEPVGLEWLYSRRCHLWMHCKCIRAAQWLDRSILGDGCSTWFMHNRDQAVMTSSKEIWVYPGQPLSDGEGIVAVLPEITSYTLDQLRRCYAVCTDYPFIFRKFLTDYENCDSFERTHEDLEEDYHKFLHRVRVLRS